MKKTILIGWGEIDITPEHENVELAGQYYQRIATGIHSRIKCVALAIQSGEEHAVQISLDVVGITKEFQDRVADKITQAVPEICRDNIIINAIHTHSAPYTRPTGLFREWLPAAPGLLQPAEYVEFLIGKIVAAVMSAWSKRAPGGIATGFGTARIGHCRRPVFRGPIAQMYGDTSREDFIGLEAGEDSGVELCFTFDESDRPTGVIANIPCPSQVMEATRKISSDFMGAGRELLKERFGTGFHTLCQVSAAGCQAPRDLVRRFRTEPDFWHEDGVPILARRMFNAVMEGFDSHAKIDHAPVFRHRSQVVSLPVRRASFSEYQQALAKLEELLKTTTEREAFEAFCEEELRNERIPGRAGPYDDKEMAFVQIQNCKAVLTRYRTQNDAPDRRFRMHTVRLGDAVITTNPFELYLLFGQIMKARSRARQTFIVQLAGDSLGYLPSPDAERFSGYGGMIVNGTVGSDGGYKLVEDALDQINDILKD